MNNRVWTTDLIGVLGEDDPVETFNKQSIFINSQNTIQFLVELISQPPESFPNVKLITCFASDLEKWGFEDDLYRTDEERKQNLREFLNDSLIVFTAERRILHNHAEVYKATNIRLIPKAESFNNNVSLFPIPIFSEEQNKLSDTEFINKLADRKFVGRIDNISNEPNDTPAFILWHLGGTEYKLFGEFDKHQHAHGGFSFSIRGELKSISFNNEWLDDSYVDQIHIPNLMFVTLETYQNLTGEMEVAEKVTIEEIETVTDKFDEDKLPVIDESEDNGIELVEIDKKSQNETNSYDQASAALELMDIANRHDESPEFRFLDHFISTTHELGLLYSEKDLINFHTAMKSSNLVILAGMSGTGKSKLVHAYSRALGLYSDQFTFIPVRPSWTDDADLIGYADTLHMVYRPGDSGLINALRQAEKDEDKMYIICFDEMNLARVEHYFSQFLSILELESGRRELRLYNDELETRLYNSAQYPPTIPIKDNVIFAGTVNLDESTYHFSDKVLDRSNVIEIKVLPFENLKAIDEKKKLVHSRDHVINYEIYDSFKNKNRSIDLKDAELNFLWDLHNLLQDVNKEIGVGPRIVRQIDAFLKNLPENQSLNRSEALDIQIVQRILTKVRGSEDQLQDLIGNFDKDTGKVHNSKFIDLLKKYESISQFNETKKVITHKARELKFNGYTV